MTEPLAWGGKVSPQFRTEVRDICRFLQIDPSNLMACMAFESGGTFSPSIHNAAGSGAVGLIQFMPQTAAALGTTAAKLAAMSATQQLGYVEMYFKPWRGRLHNLGDVYLAILWPNGIGRADSYVLFDKADPHHPVRYQQNAGLDANKDGKVTRGETIARVAALRAKGLLPGNVSE